MIGANGTGKTSVLDVLTLLANSAQGKLNDSISELSGLTNILTYDRADELHLGVSMKMPTGEPLEYLLRLRQQGIGYVIGEETLSQRRPPDPSPLLFIRSNNGDVSYGGEDVGPLFEDRESALSQVPKTFRPPEQLRTRLSSAAFYHGIAVDPRSSVRLPQPLRPAVLPGRNGEDLVSCLFIFEKRNVPASTP
jgi:predicted ATPase